jgi:hypothetical protein
MPDSVQLAIDPEQLCLAPVFSDQAVRAPASLVSRKPS